jgi:hypothetical protein
MSVWLSATTLALLAASIEGPLLPDSEVPDGGLVSRQSATPTTVRFANETAAAVSLYWMNFKGERELYGTIEPRTSRTVRTYLTHPWIVTDAQGQPLGTFLPQRVDATALIQPRLAPLAPGQEAKLRSQQSKERATIRFINRSGGLVHLYWLDYKGERNLRARVDAEREHVVETFASHPWIAVDEEGDTLGLFQAQRGDFDAVISSKGTAP